LKSVTWPNLENPWNGEAALNMQGTGTNPSRCSSRLADNNHLQSIGAGSALSAGPPTSTSTAEAAHAKLESLAKDSIPFRLLNALLTHAPTVEGVGVIASDIIAASAEPGGLDRLAEFYKTGLLLPSRLLISNSGPTAFSINIHGQ
jgi:hypothetical protein